MDLRPECTGIVPFSAGNVDQILVNFPAFHASVSVDKGTDRRFSGFLVRRLAELARSHRPQERPFAVLLPAVNIPESAAGHIPQRDIHAARPEVAIPLYERFCAALSEALGKPVPTGTFGADMQVSLVNDGPVTICIDTKNKE